MLCSCPWNVARLWNIRSCGLCGGGEGKAEYTHFIQVLVSDILVLLRLSALGTREIELFLQNTAGQLQLASISSCATLVLGLSESCSDICCSHCLTLSHFRDFWEGRKQADKNTSPLRDKALTRLLRNVLAQQADWPPVPWALRSNLEEWVRLH